MVKPRARCAVGTRVTEIVADGHQDVDARHKAGHDVYQDGCSPHLRSVVSRVSKDEAALGPHGSPGDAKHRPEDVHQLLRHSLTASLSLSLLGRAALLTMRPESQYR